MTPGTDALLRALDRLWTHFAKRAYGTRGALKRARLRRLARMLDALLGPYGL